MSHQDRYLLCVNERNEYELLGGKLEHGDNSLADRVCQEFLEESGIVVHPKEILEPWFYVLGDRAVLIVSMNCTAASIPETLFDQDGGQLEWIEEGHLDSIALPTSYLASIRGKRPSLTRFAGNPGPPYPDDQFDVTLVVEHTRGVDNHELHEACDFTELLTELGYPQATFRTVRLLHKEGLRVVFASDD